MRYGVLVDLARRVRRGDSIDVTMGYFNVIWQADANAMALAALAHASAPPFIVNLAGREELGVRAACTELARLLGVSVSFTGQEARDALLSNGARGWERLGRRASMPHACSRGRRTGLNVAARAWTSPRTSNRGADAFDRRRRFQALAHDRADPRL